MATTQIRMAQLTGSMPTDSEDAAASTGLAAGNLGVVLNHMASAIKRVHGGATFTAQAAGVFAGRIQVDDTTAATSTTDGSLQTDGGLSVALDAIIGDDVYLLSDSAVLGLGAGKDATLTHDGTTGLTIAATPISINSTGDLTLDSSTDIVLDADGADVIFKDGGTESARLTMDGTTSIELAAQGDIILDPAGNNVIPGSDSTDSLGSPLATSYSETSWGAFSYGRIQTDPITSSTTSISMSPEVGTTASAGEIVRFKDGSGNYIAYTMTYGATSESSIIIVVYLAAGSNVTTMAQSAIASVVKLSATVTGAQWANVYTDNVTLDGQGRIDLDDDADTSIRASADDVITFEIGGSDLISMKAAGLQIIDDKKLMFGSTSGGDASFEYDEDDTDTLLYDGASIRITDDTKLEFGTGGDASFEYDEDGTDTLLYDGASIRITDDTKLEFGTGGDASFEYDEDGNDVLLYAGASMRIGDDIKLEFGAAGDASIEYDEDGTDQLRIAAPSAGVVIAGTTPTLVIGDAGEEDAKMVFDGNAQDFHMGLDDSADDLVLGVGSTLGTTTSLALDENRNVDVAAHNASSVGLKLGGTIVTASAAELNYLDIAAAGASEASKALVTDASGDIYMPDSDKFELGASSDMQLYHDGTNSYIANKTGALKIATETSGIAVTIGHSTSEVTVADNLTVSGDLTVTGTTVTDSVEVISTSSGVLFEGGTDDGHEGTLISAVAGADVTYTLPNLTGHIPVLAGAAANANVTSAEFHLLDGGSSVGTTTVADGDGIFTNADGTMKHTTVETFQTYFDANSVGGTSIVTVGTIGTGTWNGTAIASAYLDADTAHLTGTQTFSGAKTFSAAATISDNTAASSATTGALKVTGGISTQADLFVGDDLALISDAAVLSFGADSEITLTHVADKGLTITNTNTVDDKPVILQLKSEEDAVIADEVIASMEFAAGDSDGTDGATVAAGIHAIAEETFAADANATKLVFTTADSETAAASATAKMTLASTGNLTTAGSVTAVGSFIIGSADMSEADLEKLDGITNGTAAASKAVVLDSSKNIATIGTIGCGAITSTGTSTFSTAVTPAANGGADLGSSSVGWDDLYLADGGVLQLGDDQDVTLTHVADAGLLLNSTRYISFQDSGTKIYSSGDGVLDLASDGTSTTAAMKLTSAGGISLIGGDNNDSIYVENSPIQFQQIAAPDATTDKLYNVSGTLYFNGTALSSTAPSVYNVVINTDLANDTSGALTAGDALVSADWTTVGGSTAWTSSTSLNKIQVYVNGQLQRLHASASTHDAYFTATSKQLKFAYDLALDDVVQVIVYV